jgi:hypothetical protein
MAIPNNILWDTAPITPTKRAEAEGPTHPAEAPAAAGVATTAIILAMIATAAATALASSAKTFARRLAMVPAAVPALFAGVIRRALTTARRGMGAVA